MEWSHSKGLLHCQTLHEEQSGSRSSKSVKQDMEEENVLQSTINSENLPIIIESDLEKWLFNSYSRGYHKYINIWEPLIYRKKKEMCMILILWPLFEETMSSDMSPKVYVASFRTFYLCLTH